MQNSTRLKAMSRVAVDDEYGNVRESCLFVLLPSHVRNPVSTLERAVHPTFYLSSAWWQRYAISVAGYSCAGEVIR